MCKDLCNDMYNVDIRNIVHLNVREGAYNDMYIDVCTDICTDMCKCACNDSA